MAKKNFFFLRKKMVEEQIIPRGIRDERVIKALLEVPREEFVQENQKELAYEDYPLSIGFGQTISQPFIVALMTEALEVKEEDKILEVGTGSGYQAAVLAHIGAKVFSIERIPQLAERAEMILKKLGYSVKIKVGDGTLGWKEEAPFSKIIVTAAGFKEPEPLIEELEEGGIMVIPLGGFLSQRLVRIRKVSKDKLDKEDICGCVFVPLIGKYGFRE